MFEPLSLQQSVPAAEENEGKCKLVTLLWSSALVRRQQRTGMMDSSSALQTPVASSQHQPKLNALRVLGGKGTTTSSWGSLA